MVRKLCVSLIIFFMVYNIRIHSVFVAQAKQRKKDTEVERAISLSLAKIGLGSATEYSIQQLLEKLKIPGLEYGVFASQVAVELWKGVQNLKKDSYVGTLKESMGYYLGASEASVGGWSFGQHKPTGKIYVRIDTPCHSLAGHVHVYHRELLLKNAYPFRDISKQMGQIMAGEFELGEYNNSELGPRNSWVNLFE